MQWVPLKQVSDKAGSIYTLKRWAKAGFIRAKRLARGHGPWFVLVDEHGLPVDA